jgi:hypothetical protein
VLLCAHCNGNNASPAAADSKLFCPVRVGFACSRNRLGNSGSKAEIELVTHSGQSTSYLHDRCTMGPSAVLQMQNCQAGVAAVCGSCSTP